MIGQIIKWWDIYEFLITYVLMYVILKIYAPDLVKFFVIFRLFFWPRLYDRETMPDAWFLVFFFSFFFYVIMKLEGKKDYFKCFCFVEGLGLIEARLLLCFYEFLVVLACCNIILYDFYYKNVDKNYKKLDNATFICIFLCTFSVVQYCGYTYYKEIKLTSKIMYYSLITNWYFINYIEWFYSINVKHYFQYWNNYWLEYYLQSNFWVSVYESCYFESEFIEEELNSSTETILNLAYYVNWIVNYYNNNLRESFEWWESWFHGGHSLWEFWDELEDWLDGVPHDDGI